MGEDKWEIVGGADHTFRLKVPGGWLYRYGRGTNVSDHCMVFVPSQREHAFV